MNRFIKKIVAVATVLTVFSFVAGPAFAVTVEELQASINSLMATLAGLQAQLAALQGTPTGTTACTITSFDTNLSQGMTGEAVKCLQKILNSSTDTQVASSGAGSPGNETTYFGALTKAAVILFQQKYASEILTPIGLTAGTGLVGAKTRAKLNTMLGVIPPPTGCTTDAQCGAAYMCVAGACVVRPSVGTGLSIALSAVTPAAATVPATTTYAASDVPFTKVNFTAGTDGAVTITSLKVIRKGLSNDAALSSLKLYDDSIQVGTSQSLGATHKASFNNISIIVPAGTTKTITLAGDLNPVATYSGNIIQLGIDVATDITTTAAVTGTFPIVGNSMTLTSSVTIGSATFDNGSSGTRNESNLTVDPSETDIRFTQIKITAGSAEGLKITQVTAIKQGTAATTDVKDIKLVNDTTGATLGTLASLPADGKAVFSNLNVDVAKGGYVELSVLATLISGSGRTLTFDFYDGTAWTIKMTGLVYGFGITPTVGTFGDATTYLCTAQTINQGYLTVKKSASTPATGNIALGGSQQELSAFDFTAGGEAVNVSSTKIVLTPAAGTGSANKATYWTNITGYDNSGNVLFGPKDGTTTTDNTAEDVTFTDAYTIPTGTTIVRIKANVSTSTTAGNTIKIDMHASGITGKGAVSGKTTYTTSAGAVVPPGASDVTANTMTVLGPALAVRTASIPIATTYVLNAQGVTFANFDLDAGASGEDIKVTSVIVHDTLTGGTAYTGINNLVMYDGATKIETTNSTATNAHTVTFTFKVPIKVAKGTTKRLTLKADVVNLTDSTGHTFAIEDVAENVVCAGWTTGTTMTETYAGAGQLMTIGSLGTLQITVSADRPAAAQFAAGKTGQSMMEYKLYAVNEDISITAFYIATEGNGTTTTGSDVAKVKLYLEGTILGNPDGYTLSAATHGNALVSLSSGMLTVPKSTYKTLTMKVDLIDKASLTDADTLEVGLGDGSGDYSDWGANGAASTAGTIRYYMIATGVSSGSTIVNNGTSGWINSTATTAGTIAASYTNYLYDGILLASLNTTVIPVSPSGTQTAGAGKEVLSLNLTADGDDIEINEMEFCVAGTATTTGTGSLTIKSSDLGTTYATISATDFNTYWNAVEAGGTHTYEIINPNNEHAVASGTNCFSIGDNVGLTTTKNIIDFTNTITIATGATKMIRIFGDTTGALTTTSLQLTCGPNAVNSATTSGIEWQNNTGTDVDATLTKNLPITGGSLIY